MEPLSLSGVGEGRAHTRTTPGRSYQVPERTTPGASAGECRYPVPMLRVGRVGLFVLAVVLSAAACSGGPAPSFDPTGECMTDGRAPGAYPDLEALVPTIYQGVAPATLDSGRNCTVTNLGSLARLGISEVRFAGGTWAFGAERAAVLAVFRTHGLTADYLASFYNESARAAGRTKILGASDPMIAGREGHRLDTMTGERVQTVVVWPSAQPDVVNVVITNDLPDPRIQDAIDAFGGA
jgi:hypothetical protein